MRLIDADTLDCLAWTDGEHGTAFDDGVLWVLEKIDALPSIKQKKGKWLNNYQPGYKCSECGGYLEIDCGDVEMNFCPNCGADMRGEDGEL